MQFNLFFHIFLGIHSLENTSLARQLQRLSKDNTAYFPVSIQEDKKYHTFDTVENRFIKYFLGKLLELLTKLKNKTTLKIH